MKGILIMLGIYSLFFNTSYSNTMLSGVTDAVSSAVGLDEAELPPPTDINKDHSIFEPDKEAEYFSKLIDVNDFISKSEESINDLSGTIETMDNSLNTKLQKMAEIVDSVIVQNRAYKITSDSLNVL